jgi:hypothetical protein
MNRSELEHIIRAAGEIAQVEKVIILGSQSILAQFPDLSELVSNSAQTEVAARIQNREILIRSIEADIMIPDSEEKTELVEICNENTNGISGLCIEIHDVMASKLYAGRPKDIEFFNAAVNLGLLSKEILRERLAKTAMSDERRNIVEGHIKRGFSK